MYEKALKVQHRFAAVTVAPNAPNNVGASSSGSSTSASNVNSPRLSTDDFIKIVGEINKDPKKEDQKLEDEDAKAINEAFLARADLDWDRCVILETELAKLNPAVLKAYNHTPTHRATVFKRYIDSNTEPLPEDDTDAMNCLAQDRSLDYFDVTMATHFLKGNVQKIQALLIFWRLPPNGVPPQPPKSISSAPRICRR